MVGSFSIITDPTGSEGLGWYRFRGLAFCDRSRNPAATILIPFPYEIRKRRRLKLPEVVIKSVELGGGQRKRILELYDLPTTVLIDDLEARKLTILFLDVELARLVYHMV